MSLKSTLSALGSVLALSAAVALAPNGVGMPSAAASESASSRIAADPYVSAYSRSLTLGGPTFSGGTIRMPADPTLSGSSATLTLSNRFGDRPLDIGAVSLGTQESAGNATGTPTPVTFGGARNVSIPAGQDLTSDPVNLTITAGKTLLVSIYVPGPTPLIAVHSLGMETTYFTSGNRVDDITTQAYDAGPTTSTYILSSLQVSSPNGKAIVALGDSITDGYASNPGTQGRWPQRLAARLRDAGVTNVSVPNAGISANKVTLRSSGTDGDAAVARFDADVLAQPGVSSVFIFEGINDMQSTVSADAVITAYKDLIARSRAKGLKVNMATIGPWKGWGTYTDEREANRQAINSWIRTQSTADYVADFDAALRDPANPSALAPVYDVGDHLHPNQTGMQAMADAVDLSKLAY